MFWALFPDETSVKKYFYIYVQIFKGHTSYALMIDRNFFSLIHQKSLNNSYKASQL